ncbi:hypothetical protein DB30_06990 [Enhygromyxa salina]|uniref:Chaperone DnaJ C-terminal domain-containing protein n=1 Tax=Enhygromyxa salina TaxID=215803 RepID=A0A0C2CSV1_9BACT|nr:hypothetical protein [Enhygromyxa salina]KIG14241.1 hypothetical protein DB30_06990 [Enhygromyxa salina]
MGELGSVFEDDDGELPRGPDLRVSVEIPRAALGATLRAPVPARIAVDGELLERVVLHGEDPNTIELHLPEQLPERAMLRLRGQGAASEDGRAGDLLVVVELVDRPPRDTEVISFPTQQLSRRADDSVAGSAGGETDITWWVLMGLVLLGGGALLLLAL